MKKLSPPVVLIMFALLVWVPSSFSKDNKGKRPASAPAKESAAAPAAGGWREVQTNTPALIKVSYKIDATYIVINFKNLSQAKMLRVKYQAKWKKLEKGKWVDDSTSDGLTLRMKKGEELKKEVRTHAKDLKDIVIEVEASELS